VTTSARLALIVGIAAVFAWWVIALDGRLP
jgi:hypothetical protein